jgi:hypothetical protein
MWSLRDTAEGTTWFSIQQGKTELQDCLEQRIQSENLYTMQCQIVTWLINRIRIWKEVAAAWYYTLICLEGQGKTMKALSHKYPVFRARYNQVYPKFESRNVPLRQPAQHILIVGSCTFYDEVNRHSVRCWNEWWTGRCPEGNYLSRIDVIIMESAWRDWSKTRKISVRIADVPTEIQTQHLSKYESRTLPPYQPVQDVLTMWVVLFISRRCQKVQ